MRPVLQWPIVGFTGAAGSGKDTAARLLSGLVEPVVVMLAFADPLRDMVSALLNVDASRFDDREWKETPLPEFGGKTPRNLLQTLGTEWGRDTVCPDIWVQSLALRWKDLREFYETQRVHALVTDVRFDNEASWIRSQGGVLVRVIRPGTGKISGAGHRSEHSATFSTEFSLFNDGTIDELREQIRSKLVKEASYDVA